MRGSDETGFTCSKTVFMEEHLGNDRSATIIRNIVIKKIDA